MKVVDLFCGCGGLSLGFQKAGFKIIAAFDNWDDAIAVYHTNFKHPVIKQDLSDVDETVKKVIKYKPNMIIGGPPCQAYSLVGRARSESKMIGDSRNYLYKLYAEFLKK